MVKDAVVQALTTQNTRKKATEKLRVAINEAFFGGQECTSVLLPELKSLKKNSGWFYQIVMSSQSLITFPFKDLYIVIWTQSPEMVKADACRNVLDDEEKSDVEHENKLI